MGGVFGLKALGVTGGGVGDRPTPKETVSGGPAPSPPEKAAWEAPLAEAEAAMAKDDGEVAKAALAKAVDAGVPAIRAHPVQRDVDSWSADPVLAVLSPAEGATIQPGADGTWTIDVTGSLVSGRKTDAVWVDDEQVRRGPGAYAKRLTSRTAGPFTFRVEVRDGTTVRKPSRWTVRLVPPLPPIPPPPAVPTWTAPLAEAETAMAKDDGEVAKAALAKAIAADAPASRLVALQAYVAEWDREPVLTVASPTKSAEIESGADGKWHVEVRGTVTTGRKGDRVLVDGKEVRTGAGAFAIRVERTAAGADAVTVEVRSRSTTRKTQAAPFTLKPRAFPVPEWFKGSQQQVEEAKRLGDPVAFEEPTTGMRFVLIPSGSFLMGSPTGEEGREPDEGPQHQVTVAPFYLSAYETTNAQYRLYRADHRSSAYFQGAASYGLNGNTQPVTWVSHADATEFATWLSTRGSGAGKGAYRLPSEAEWEYACRAGTRTRFSFGDRYDDLPPYGNFSDKNDPSRKVRWDLDDGHDVSAAVGSYRPNPWGLYDVHGNVREWCADDYHATYDGAPSNGSAWIDSTRAVNRVYRSGAWYGPLECLRSGARSWYVPSFRSTDIGFRLARAVTPK